MPRRAIRKINLAHVYMSVCLANQKYFKKLIIFFSLSLPNFHSWDCSNPYSFFFFFFLFNSPKLDPITSRRAPSELLPLLYSCLASPFPNSFPRHRSLFKDLLAMYFLSDKIQTLYLVHMVFAKYSSPPVFPDLFFIAPSMNISTNHAIYQFLNTRLLPILHIQQLALNCPIKKYRVKLNKTVFSL